MTRAGVGERHIRDLAPALKNRDGLVFSFWMLPMPGRLHVGTATASWPGLSWFVPAIDDLASLQQRRLDARDKLGHEAGPGPVI